MFFYQFIMAILKMHVKIRTAEFPRNFSAWADDKNMCSLKSSELLYGQPYYLKAPFTCFQFMAFL